MAYRFDTLLPPRVLLGALLLAGALAAHADAGMRTTQIKVGPHPLRVEIAQTDPDRERGLMHRRSMGANDGMLFIFAEPAYHAMWMKNTLIPLSVAFVDSEGVILNILDMEPQTLDTHMSAGPSVYAI